MTQQEINRRLCEYGASGEIVVRLKGGDGAVFGRAAEEMEALRAAGVAFSIVPGVTAASGAAAAAGVSLTDRRLGSSLVFVTAQRCKGNSPPNWKAIAELGGTAAIYMPGGHEPDLARQLIESGLPAHTPCVVVARASRADERAIRTTLGELPALPQLPAPALLLIGVIPPGTASAVTALEEQGISLDGH
jgi:siroheme synthase